LRFVIEGHPDLYTVVNGEVCTMEKNDLVLTPNWNWHDHHNNSPSRAIWLDVLDGPMVAALKQTLFENYGEDQQPVRNEAASGELHFPWADMAKRLDDMSDGDISDHDGKALEYRHPKTGGAVFPTLGCWINELPAGFEGAPHRHSSSAVYFVVSGAGQTRVGDVTLDWGERDSFTVPAWATHSHINVSKSEQAMLFSASEAPALQALGLYREDPAPDGSGTS
jgi:gentisate 1,2-dioxygenase/1-hydroxy-2-naphthoate dioxygenase